MTAVRDDLRELNVAIGAAEKAHDLQLLRELPDDGLIFRRPTGGLSARATTSPLAKKTYDTLNTEVLDVDRKGAAQS